MRDWELHLGDALEVLPGMAGGSVDAVVADPPAGVSFVGVEWDTFPLRDRGELPGGALPKQTPHKHGRGFANGMTFDKTSGGRAAFLAFLTPVMAECLRVLKPGGYALVWALPRTSHWTATALDDAGFEIRDVITHLFGQGFPKGKGCLKPASEHWILCRRPGPRVLPLNIDEARIPIVGPVDPQRQRYNQPGNGSVGCGGVYEGGYSGDYDGAEVPHPDSPRHDARGRWPANVTLEHSPLCVCRGTKRVRGSHDGGKPIVPITDPGYGGGFSSVTTAGYAGPDGAEEVEDWACHPECPVFLLDSQAGERTSGGGLRRPNPSRPSVYNAATDKNPIPPNDYTRDASTGNVSRFFYVSKADKADRGEGNDHPTAKSTALMSWLVRLVSRQGETVLDPSAGSGSTGVAALRCERRFVGIERDPHYFQIAQRRLAAVDGPLFARPAGEAAP